MPGSGGERVLLLHGIWMRAPTLWWLQHRLRRAGFEPQTFAYASVFGTPERALQRLCRRLRNHNDGPLHWVGHSLGGLLALAACGVCPSLPPGRIVCIGTPLAGSTAAFALGQWPGLRSLSRGWREMLTRGAASLPAGREVGSIAGDRRLGLGALLSKLPLPHDGTVAVEETRITGLADHRVVRASHSGLLVNPAVSAATARFLRHGSFSLEPEDAATAARGRPG